MKVLMIVIAAALLAGCASISVDHPEFGKIQYSRFFSQRLGIELVTPGGLILRVDQLSTETAADVISSVK